MMYLCFSAHAASIYTGIQEDSIHATSPCRNTICTQVPSLPKYQQGVLPLMFLFGEETPLCCAESGGVCTFCGAKVALSSQESSHARPPYAERVAAPASQEQPASSAPAGSAVDDSAAEAVALKNRLVRAHLICVGSKLTP